LGFDRVLGGSIKGFDAQVLFDPFEEQFNLPTALVEFGNSECRQDEIVGQEDKALVGLDIQITDAP